MSEAVAAEILFVDHSVCIDFEEVHRHLHAISGPRLTEVNQISHYNKSLEIVIIAAQSVNPHLQLVGAPA